MDASYFRSNVKGHPPPGTEAGGRAKENTRTRSPAATEKRQGEGGWVLRLGRAPSRPRRPLAGIATLAHLPPDRNPPDACEAHPSGRLERRAEPPRNGPTEIEASSRRDLRRARSAAPIRPRRSSDTTRPNRRPRSTAEGRDRNPSDPLPYRLSPLARYWERGHERRLRNRITKVNRLLASIELSATPCCGPVRAARP